MSEKRWKNDNFWISKYNFENEVVKNFDFPKNIEIHDATLRDGEQTPGVVFRKHEKLQIAQSLNDAGIQRIEAGMPAVSEEDRQAVIEMSKMNLNSKIYAFARAEPKDMELCLDCGCDGVIIEVPIGKPKLEKQFKFGIETSLERSQAAIEKAKSCGLHTIIFPYDATRCEEDDLEFYLNGLKGAYLPDGIGLVDTMGCASPEAIAYMTRLYKQKLNIPVEIHVHNDFGLGLAATIASLQAGATVAHGATNGMGERTGNVATEEIAATLQIMYGIDMGVDIEKMIASSRLIEKLSNYPVSNKKPVIGRGNYVREAGVGADTVMNDPLAMFSVMPSYFSQKPSVVLGKKSGLRSIELKLDAMNIEIEREKRKAILGEVKIEGIEKKRLLTDEEFMKIVDKYK